MSKVCCHECAKGKVSIQGWPITLVTFIVCPDCGNKRCPRATNHNNACTGSNKPGQHGSCYQ